eukprot:12880953-Prorocentrum_lima.AAC.1
MTGASSGWHPSQSIIALGRCGCRVVRRVLSTCPLPIYGMVVVDPLVPSRPRSLFSCAAVH